jgi:hypothetical protein
MNGRIVALVTVSLVSSIIRKGGFWELLPEHQGHHPRRGRVSSGDDPGGSAMV